MSKHRMLFIHADRDGHISFLPGMPVFIHHPWNIVQESMQMMPRRLFIDRELMNYAVPPEPAILIPVRGNNTGMP